VGCNFEYDTKNILYVRIDRKRKLPGLDFLRAGHEIPTNTSSPFYTNFMRISFATKDLYWNFAGHRRSKLTHRSKSKTMIDYRATSAITENLVKNDQARSRKVLHLGGPRRCFSVATWSIVNRRSFAGSQQASDRGLCAIFAKSGVTEVRVLTGSDDIASALAHARHRRHSLFAKKL